MIRNLARVSIATVAIVSLTSTCTSPASGAGYKLAHTFQQAVPQGGDYFGTAVALEGNVAAIKSHSGYQDGDGLSTTHVFEMVADGSWAEAATLEFDSGDNEGNPFIGQELAIDGGEIMIGYGQAYNDEFPSQAAIQFATRTEAGWVVRFNEPVAGAPQPRDIAPGRSVDISGNLAIADDPGAYQMPGVFEQGRRGLARIYERASDGVWRETASLFPNRNVSVISRAYRPHSVAIDGSTVIIASRSGTILDPEVIHFFKRSPSGEWNEVGSFDDGGDIFARAVYLDGDVAVLESSSIKGVQVYERTSLGQWERTQRIEGSLIADNAFASFGTVALEGDLLAASVEGFDDLPSRIEIYRRNAPGEWALFDTIVDPGINADNIVTSLDFDDGRLLIGVLPRANFDSEPGAAYLFVPVPEPNTLAILALGVIVATTLRRR